MREIDDRDLAGGQQCGHLLLSLDAQAALHLGGDSIEYLVDHPQ